MRLWCFNNSSFHGKWNEVQLLLINLVYTSCLKSFFCFFVFVFFCFHGFLHRHWPFRVQQGPIFYSILPLPLTHEQWYIYLQLFMWDDYHVFLIATLVFARLLLDEIYHLIELPFEWLTDDAMFVCLLDELILGFCYSSFTLETSGFELASTTTLALQANQLTKCTSHPIKCASYMIWLTINK